MSERLPTWVHASSCVTSVQGGQVHATIGLRKPTKRRTWDTICGLQRARVLVENTVSKAGGPVTGRITITWPMKARRAKEEGLTRCPDCLSASPRGNYPEQRP